MSRSAWLSPHNLADAAEAQREMATVAESTDRHGAIKIVAGVDTSMKWRDSRGPIHAAVAPFAVETGAVLPAASASLIPPMPYIPGYLGFREVPALLAAWQKLAVKPDLILVDGHGRAHPRRCGIAVHLGVVLDMPTIGVAKSILCGAIDGVLGDRPGDMAPLIDHGEVVAMALRTRARALPIYVSIGHRVSLDRAIDLVKSVSDGRRLPLPIRLAHEAANQCRREYEAQSYGGL